MFSRIEVKVDLFSKAGIVECIMEIFKLSPTYIKNYSCPKQHKAVPQYIFISVEKFGELPLGPLMGA